MLRAAFRSWKQLASTAVLECGGNRSPPLSYSVASASPLWHLKPTKAKVLIQHGEIDDRVPLSQGTMLYRILDELGVDVKMVT
ncbi:MAG TPA: prolyl oligopeptidase family serine peptidase, partial [Thermoanaerobaculia bacterium]